MSGSHNHSLRGGFIERTIDGLHSAIDRSLYADHAASRRGLLQRLDPRVKVAGLFGLILDSALVSKLWVVAAVLIAAVVLAGLSFLSIRTLATRVWLATLTFSGILAIPALFLTPGEPIFRVPGLHWDVASQGVTTAGLLIFRAETAATLVTILVFTTPWMHILKALRMFRVPVVFVVILSMTCRYILLMLDSAREMFESRKSRTVGTLTRGQQRRVAVLSIGALLSRTLLLSDEVYLSMRSRGFRGEVYILDDFRMRSFDWLAVTLFGGLAGALVWVGR